MSIMIAIPTLNLVTTEFMNCCLALRFPMNEKVQFFFFKDHAKQGVAEMRNKAVILAEELGFDYIFFIDDDVLFNADVLQKMYAHKKTIVNGIYWRKQMPSEPLLFKEWGKGSWSDYPENQLVRCVGAGLGMTLIDLKIFKLLAYPYFETINAGNGHKTTEDIYFYKQCECYNIPIFCDTSVECGHIDKANNFDLYWKGNKYDLEAQQEILNKYTRDIKA